MRCWILALLTVGCAGTSLAPVDSRAEVNQQRAAEYQIAHLEGLGLDGGCVSPRDLSAVRSLAETIYCSAGGTLQRAGLPHEEAGIPCPAQ